MGCIIEHCGGNIHSVTYQDPLRIITMVTPAGATFFCAPAYKTPNFANVNFGSESMQLEISANKRNIAYIRQLVILCVP